MKIKKFKKQVEDLINRLGIDSFLGVPDYAIADYLANQLEVLCYFEANKNLLSIFDKEDNNE